MTYTAGNQTRAEKARNLRYKKAALKRFNLCEIRDEIYDIGCECGDIKWYMDDQDTLLNALDGDSDDEYEFRMMFSDLSANCERLQCVVNEEYVTEYFDDFLVGSNNNGYRTIGFDSEEEDYFALCGFDSQLAQTESGKRLQRLTKSELISTAGQVFGIITAYLDITQKHDYLKATFDILRNDNTAHLQIIKQINKAYDKAAADDFSGWGKLSKDFDTLISQLPDRTWVE